jgi:CRP-like cAMP-binding protein
MITPELLSRYPVFSFLKPAQLKKIAKIASEETFERGQILFREKASADAFYILLKGSIELFFTVEVEYHPELRKELKFRVIYPGESFGISAFIDPHILTASARASEPSQVVKIKAEPLLELCREDTELAYTLIYQVAKVAIDRLNATRLQLAAAWTPPQTIR